MKRRRHRDRCRSCTVKQEHDLRRAGFATIQTHFADFIEIRTSSHSASANRSRFGSLRFTATREQKPNCNCRTRKPKGVHPEKALAAIGISSRSRWLRRWPGRSLCRSWPRARCNWARLCPARCRLRACENRSQPFAAIYLPCPDDKD